MAGTVVAILTTPAGPVGSAAAAGSGIDPYVTWVSGFRHVNGTYPSNYDYGINGTAANAGDTTFTQDNYYFHYVLFNQPGVEAFTWDGQLRTTDILSNGQSYLVLLTPTAADSPFNNVSTYYCCAEIVLKLPDNSQSDDTSNDYLANNTLNLAVNPSGIVVDHVAAYNHLDHTVTLSVGSPDLPDGWTIGFNRTSLEVAGGDVGYVQVTLQAPASVLEWPDFHVWFTGNSDHGIDQFTHIHTRDGTKYMSSCGAEVLL